MNWYKKAQHLETHDDRNIVNEKIHYLESIREDLMKLSEVVFQDAKYAKQASFTLANEKKISSYPIMRDMLLTADKVALDSPWKFADLCLQLVEEIDIKVSQLKKERKEFVEKTLPNRMKGLVDNAS